NMLFLAAGEAAGKAAGSSWDNVIRERIFTPLGMTASAPTYRGVTNPNIARGHGFEHDTAFIKPPFDADNIAPAGAILSNAVDMAQWLRFQLNDGQANGKRLLSSAALRETHTSQIVVPPGSLGGGGLDSVPTSFFSTYGFGWIIEDYRGQLVWQHGGNTEGMTAAVGMLPNKKFGVVVLSNMGQASLPGLLQRYIFDLELGVPKRDLSSEMRARFVVQKRRADSAAKVQEAKPKSGAQSPIPLSAFVGTFADSLYGTVNVVMKDGKLDLERGTWHGALEFVNANNFLWYVPKSAPVPPLIIKFEVAADNTVTGLYYGLGADATLLSRVKPRPASGRRNGEGGGR
ncbi:MAG: serine hydrolase, partial [Gemmatimonadota bacterium]|nr:serine hydrolase [Gemmatimonadota bacterium]